MEFLLAVLLYVQQIKEIRTAEISCYTADPAQTDNTPDIMASGKRVYMGAVANNGYPFGTKVGILGKTFIVEDRMNRRYGKDNFDIYFTNKSNCLKFGRIKAKVIIYEDNAFGE